MIQISFNGIFSLLILCMYLGIPLVLMGFSARRIYKLKNYTFDYSSFLPEYGSLIFSYILFMMLTGFEGLSGMEHSSSYDTAIEMIVALSVLSSLFYTGLRVFAEADFARYFYNILIILLGVCMSVIFLFSVIYLRSIARVMLVFNVLMIYYTAIAIYNQYYRHR